MSTQLALNEKFPLAETFYFEPAGCASILWGGLVLSSLCKDHADGDHYSFEASAESAAAADRPDATSLSDMLPMDFGRPNSSPRNRVAWHIADEDLPEIERAFGLSAKAPK